ncbi:MAG: TetR/AcrR family transcriptional regulator, partial [candidate division Zixibacteria bacterium]|nr:TetR/AcrR family transcriptional regulator [candidate division Zixibacteria bacterium]
MGTVERRQREHQETHEAIIDAAVAVFLAEGYEATSIRKIAKKIEYTPGAVYSYFKDKDEILYEIHLRGFQKFFEYLSQAQAEPNPMERLHQTGQLYLKFAAENPEYYDLMFIERSTARTITDKSCWESG